MTTLFCKNCGKNLDSDLSFCTECGSPISQTKYKKFSLLNLIKRWGKYFIVSIIILLVIALLYFNFGENNQNTNINFNSPYNQEKIAASVVNILCPGLKEDFSDATGGSGTIITDDGVVLTNSHIIPQNNDEEPLGDFCMVILPDPKTGAADEIYIGTPVIIPYLSSKYDIAAIAIEEPFVDEEKVVYGSYNKIFPAFDDTGSCFGEVQLGEPVRIFGYPALSGGYSLTITEGIVSSFPGDDLIITSAKISEGNSGGLAIDRNGCMIGIPSMVSADETESLGVILSMNLIYEFIEKFDALSTLLE